VPEGDTIHRVAARLRGAFSGAPLDGFDAPRLPEPHPRRGEAIAVAARGKHLLVGFSGGLTLHTHLGMDGWWRVGAPGDRSGTLGTGRPPGRGPQARVATARASALVGGTTTVELLDAAALRRHPALAALGPDLCDPAPDLDIVRARLAALDPATPIGEVLLDQRPACGIGNVYRAEVLWFERTAPRTTLGSLDEEARRRLYTTAHRLLRANLGPGRRATLAGGLAVYERAGRPCPRCRTAIRAERLGERARTVWWCPACQTDG
jgi:endonuclease-8